LVLAGMLPSIKNPWPAATLPFGIVLLPVPTFGAAIVPTPPPKV
jgi:hypothetical protein